MRCEHCPELLAGEISEAEYLRRKGLLKMKEITLREVLTDKTFQHFLARLLQVKGVKSVNIVGGIVYRQKTENDVDVVIEALDYAKDNVWQILESYVSVYNPVKEHHLIKVGALEVDFFLDECHHTKPCITLRKAKEVIKQQEENQAAKI